MATTNSKNPQLRILLLNSSTPITVGSELDDLIYDLIYPSAFFEKPLVVDIPHLKQKVTVGHGLGGFSALYFQRKYLCTQCGRCCRDNVRGSWFWFIKHELSPCISPAGILFEEQTIGINDIPVTVHIFRNALHPTKCEFLEDLPDGRGLCSIHFNKKGSTAHSFKNTLCRTFLDLYPVVKRDEAAGRERLYFSKRLSGYNWKKLKCPAEWETIDEGQKNWDSDLMWRYTRLIEEVPGNLGWEIYSRFMNFYDQKRFYETSCGSQFITFEEVLKSPIYSID